MKRRNYKNKTKMRTRKVREREKREHKKNKDRTASMTKQNNVGGAEEQDRSRHTKK